MTDDDRWYDEPGDEPEEDQYPDDGDDDEQTETVLCPRCGTELYEDADYCPNCQTYITVQPNAWSGRPFWWILLGLLGVLAAVLTLAGFFLR